MLAGLISLLTLLTLIAVAPAASAAGGGDCERGNCEVRDPKPGKPKKPGKPGDRDDSPRYPECNALKDALPDGAPDIPSDWVAIACMEGQILTTMWVEPGAGVDPATIARSLLARMQLRPIQIGMAPPGPRSIVGLPVWLWVDEPGRLTWGPATITAGGVSLTARVTRVTWDMDDGTVLSCQKGTPWQRKYGATKSPTCGHVYVQQGDYTIRARSYWVATWSGYGQSGTIPFTLSTSRDLEIGEVQVIVTQR